MSKHPSLYSPKVLELTAKEIANHFSGTEIVKILEEYDIPREAIQYPNTKWVTINEAFKYILENYEHRESISGLIANFLHPLNHDLNEEKVKNLADKIAGYLEYDHFYIKKDTDIKNGYQIHHGEDITEDAYLDYINEAEEAQENQIHDHEKLKTRKAFVREVRDDHQAFMDLVEVFCQNYRKPTKELNDAYLFLTKKLETSISQMKNKLRYYEISFYRPFKGDLYSAEIEWNGTGDLTELRLGPTLSWDAIRPRLYKVHSEIMKIYNVSEDAQKITSDEKKREEINALISEVRTQRDSLKESSTVTKVEITKIPNFNIKEGTLTKNKQHFYIVKKDDDFYYKGRYLNLSKKSDYYKVFCSLYTKLPEGGEVPYKDLISEIKSRVPKTKSKTDDDMQKFIQRNLTDKNNGFLRYAGIPETEDNGKSLIKIIRGSGVAFNNKNG